MMSFLSELFGETEKTETESCVMRMSMTKDSQSELAGGSGKTCAG